LATLPIGLSGLGVERPSHVLQYAHLAARADTFYLRIRQFRQFITSDPLREYLQQQFFAGLHTSIRESQLALKIRGGLCHGNPSCQKDFARLHDASKRFSLLEVNKEKWSPQQHYIFTATAKATHHPRNKTISLASQFLLALPNGGFGQIMDPVAYRAALKYRMGLPQRASNQPCHRSNCGQVNDILGHHMLSCRGKGNGTYQRHNLFAQELCGVAEAVGIMARYNAKEGHAAGFSGRNDHQQFSDFRPGDLVFMDPRQPILCVDLTIGSPLSAAKASTLDGMCPGLLMAKASQKKHRLYDDAVALHGKSFKVFAVDVAGFTNYEAIHILKQLAGAYCATNCIAYSHAYAIITRRVSFILMKHLAHQLLQAGEA
jgi:hypothetical protein